MWFPLRFCVLLLVFASGEAKKRGIMSKVDKPYEVINVKIPQKIWRHAYNPRPVLLKSPVTVVVPVQVSDEEEEFEDEIPEDEVEEVINTTLADEVVQGVSVTETAVVANDPVVTEAAPAPANDPPTVPGQVFRFPCSCVEGQCGCCTGAILQRYNMKACGNITFVPEDFVFDVRLTVNNNTMVRQRVSASDPPPICFNPRRAPFVQVCAEISNIRIRNRNAYACLDINANIGGFPVYSASFRCFSMGASGVQSGLKPKPVSSSGPKPINLYGSNNDDDDREGFLENVAGNILGGGGGESGGIFGGGEGGGLLGGGLFGGGSNSDNDGPLDGIGDAIGDFLEGRQIRD